jgi:hypothetical protein
LSWVYGNEYSELEHLYDINLGDGSEPGVINPTSDLLTASTPSRIVSNGGPSAYYEIPDHATEVRHLISHKSMSFARGNIFKACYRLGEKDGTEVLYDLNKIELFLADMREMYARGEPI